MNMNLLTDEVVVLVKKVLEKQEYGKIEDNMDLSVLGLDSLKAMELVVELESFFNIEFEDEELLFENFKIISEIVNRISGKINILAD